eukprot:11508050-Karenia_brevis.AAC.1
MVEECQQKLGLDDWVTAARRRKWRWAGHVARRSDGRWSTSLVSWVPENGHRRRGHPRKRWSDDLKAFFIWAHADMGSWIE